MIVIADDITGAAEIGGIAHSQGQQVQFVCGCPAGCGIATANTANATTVIATDTRSMSEAEAVVETRRIVSQLFPPTSRLTSSSFTTPQLFKKTDSALRGHVVAELSALMTSVGYRRALYLPANPSKGRIIRKGIYYIDGTPIHMTAFSYDPEFPATTSVLKERFPDAERHNIIMPDAESEEDIRRVIAAYNDGHTLFAGAADLYKSLTPDPIPDYCSEMIPGVRLLVLCGSTQSKALDLGIPISPMPREIYDGSEDISLWDTSDYPETHSLMLTIPYTHRTGKAAAVHLRTMMALKAKALINKHRPDHLVIEGGASAWSTLQTLSWTSFEVVRQIAPGIVQLRSACGTLVTMKPGSYPFTFWPSAPLLRQ